MRIYNFLEVTARKQNTYFPTTDNNRRRHVLPLASGGEDMIELSDQAIRHHQRGKVIAMHRAKIEKIAYELMPEVNAALDSPRVVNDRTALSMSSMINVDEETRYSGSEVLEKTADLILGFMAG